MESFNISVAAALIMYEAQQQRLRALGRQGDLSEEQQQQLLAAFLLRGVVSGWLPFVGDCIVCCRRALVRALTAVPGVCAATWAAEEQQHGCDRAAEATAASTPATFL